MKAHVAVIRDLGGDSVSIVKVKAYLTLDDVRKGRISRIDYTGNLLADRAARAGSRAAERASPTNSFRAEATRAIRWYKWVAAYAVKWESDTVDVDHEAVRKTHQQGDAAVGRRRRDDILRHLRWRHVNGKEVCRRCGRSAATDKARQALRNTPCLGSVKGRILERSAIHRSALGSHFALTYGALWDMGARPVDDDQERAPARPPQGIGDDFSGDEGAGVHGDDADERERDAAGHGDERGRDGDGHGDGHGDERDHGGDGHGDGQGDEREGDDHGGNRPVPVPGSPEGDGLGAGNRAGDGGTGISIRRMADSMVDVKATVGGTPHGAFDAQGHGSPGARLPGGGRRRQQNPGDHIDLACMTADGKYAQHQVSDAKRRRGAFTVADSGGGHIAAPHFGNAHPAVGAADVHPPGRGRRRVRDPGVCIDEGGTAGGAGAAQLDGADGKRQCVARSPCGGWEAIDALQRGVADDDLAMAIQRSHDDLASGRRRRESPSPSPSPKRARMLGRASAAGSSGLQGAESFEALRARPSPPPASLPAEANPHCLGLDELAGSDSEDDVFGWGGGLDAAESQQPQPPGEQRTAGEVEAGGGEPFRHPRARGRGIEAGARQTDVQRPSLGPLVGRISGQWGHGHKMMFKPRYAWCTSCGRYAISRVGSGLSRPCKGFASGSYARYLNLLNEGRHPITGEVM